MEKISFFLEKFKSLGLGDVALKRVFIEMVEENLHTKLNTEDVTLREGVIYVRSAPALKSELYINKKTFLKKMSDSFGPTKLSGLR